MAGNRLSFVCRSSVVASAGVSHPNATAGALSPLPWRVKGW
jgi:hypothetical protein